MESQNEFFIPINEVSKELDVPAHTLRYWEKQFPGAIRPVTGAGNRRYYRRETVEKIRGIKSLLYDKGMTIAGVKKILHNGSFNKEVADAPRAIAGQHNTKQYREPTTATKSSISALDMGDIDAAIKLLNQAKIFLD